MTNATTNVPVLIALAVSIIFLIIIIAQFIIYRGQIKKINLSKKLLDTSVIIDGRINDIAAAGFLEGIIIIPRFVLQELQFIADSSDQMKRSKGRRGLDLLNALKKFPDLVIRIEDRDYREIRAVDEKLVAMAKDYNAKIVTNDFNLNKIAEIQGVKVLNINDLSNAIKPTFLPGEKISVKVIKEGKEKEQGIAYLNDGTMIVIDGARRMMNKRVDVTVTNVLQTDAGRMIFARFEGGRSDNDHASYPSRDNRNNNRNRDNRDNRDNRNRNSYSRDTNRDNRDSNSNSNGNNRDANRDNNTDNNADSNTDNRGDNNR